MNTYKISQSRRGTKRQLAISQEMTDLVLVALSGKISECILWRWPLVGGYGRWRNKYVHRQVLVMATGGDPGSHLYACHSCRNRNCINPNHLSWKTALGNIRDKFRDKTDPTGERNPSAKLTPEQVRAIRMEPGTQQSIADKFGVTQSHVGRIKRGVSWSHI